MFNDITIAALKIQQDTEMKLLQVDTLAFAFMRCRRRNRPRIILLWSLMAASQSGFAVTIALPANIELNSMATVEVQYDDNVFLAAENEQDDWVTRTIPALDISREGTATSFSGSFSLANSHYRDSSRQSFNDYVGNFDWRWRAANFLEVQTSVNYTDLAQTISGNPDGGLDPILIEGQRTRRPSADVTFILGRQGSSAQGVIRHAKQKNAFEEPARDFATARSSIDMNYSPSNRVMLGVQLANTEFDYVDLGVVPDRDSREILVLGTAEYRLAKTRLGLRAGRLNKDFRLNERQDFAGPRWDVTASWSPKTYSTLSITTGRTVQESPGTADFVDVESSVFSWSHQWTGTLDSTLSYSRTVGEFVGEASTSNVLRSNLMIRYQPADWLRLYMGFSRLENQISTTASGIENSRYMLGVEAPL
ncbi:outer membrane beta-barrel protein [Microbulbifer harenosus]|uniref:Outer membrane beta-barrel protein n=1 Tax=Microbulbifer harenosus TaxID=2576840 RepID=A0ABY2UED6_9GAMM|nr:outer membrane beta-barrel protein [Microbulbifer harenosus]TLM75614.1 hypothetical protein FDY93_15050 [Microbulbifer harenosus]